MKLKKGVKLNFAKRHPRIILSVVSDDEILVGHANNGEPKRPDSYRSTQYILRSYHRRPELKQ